MRYAFLGSPPFAVPVFERLLASSHECVALVTRPDRPRGRGRAVRTSPLVDLARAHDVRVMQPESTRSEEFLESLAALEPEVLLVASYGEILRTPMLELAPHGALNVHGSLLPRWRGAAPIQRAILAGDTITGVAVQRIVLALDEGDVLLTRETEIGRSETSGDLFERLAVLGGEAAVAALDELAAGTATFTPQPKDGVTYAKKLTKDDGRIDWSQSSAELERFVRAMTPWPGAWTHLPDGRTLVIRAAQPCPRVPPGAAPGTLVEVEGRLCVATGDGAIEPAEVKPQGKKLMEWTAFLRGARIAAGAVLSSPEGGGGAA